MSINVFKKHSSNKITFSDISALCGELKVMGFGVCSLRWYFVSMVPGSVDCRTCCLLYITLVNSLASASSASSSTVLWCCSQRPQRMPRRMTACSRLRSSANVKPHHELAAYTSFATTTDLKMMCTDAAVMPWVLSIRNFAGHGHFVNTKRWHYWHVHAQTEYWLQ